MAQYLQPPVSLTRAKSTLGRFALAMAGVDRIHIIGCSRSGTTMLHVAMLCFREVELSEDEGEIEEPYLGKRLNLALRSILHSRPICYVTKRSRGWMKPDHVQRLLETVQRDNIGLIHLVRDPRDVMLSVYPGSQAPYVSPEHWYSSINAADRIYAELQAYKKKMTLRYEDLVLEASATEGQIGKAFNLHRKPAAHSIDRIKDNFEASRVHFATEALRNLSGLRNMDAKSIGRWRHDNVRLAQSNLNADIRTRISMFCDEHGYEAFV